MCKWLRFEIMRRFLSLSFSKFERIRLCISFLRFGFGLNEKSEAKRFAFSYLKKIVYTSVASGNNDDEPAAIPPPTSATMMTK